MLRLPSRAASVALVVPPLAQVLVRALATSAPAAARFGKPARGGRREPEPLRRFGLHDEFQPKPEPEPPAPERERRQEHLRFGKRSGADRDGRGEHDRFANDKRSPQGQRRREAPPAVQTTSKRLAPHFNKAPSGTPRPKPKFPAPAYLPYGAAPPSAARKPKASAAEPLHRQEANIQQSQPRPFAAFEMHPGLQVSLDEKYPAGKTTAIQSLALSHLLSGGRHRAILGAETGSGKTLAYLLPLLHQLKESDQGPDRSGFDGQVAPRALVLSPTHELTRQSTAVAKSLTHSAKLSVLGASSPGTVRNAGPVDVLFCTGRSTMSLLGLRTEPEAEPDRLRKPATDEGSKPKSKHPYVPEEILNLSRLEWLVVDEADVLLGPAFETETFKVLDKIRSAAGDRLNILLVTATLPPSLLRATETERLLRTAPFAQHLSPGLHRLPKKLETRFVPWSKGGNSVADVAHEIKRVFAEEALEAKLAAAPAAAELKVRRQRKDVGEEDSTAAQTSVPATTSKKAPRTMAVVFCGSVGKVTAITKALEAKAIPCLAWTGETAARNARPGHNGPLDAFLVQHKRDKDAGAVPAAAGGASTPRVLVTTSLLSRGLDFSPAVTTTYLIDPPRNVLDFVHRAGRAGRAGRPGRVVVFGMAHAGHSQYATELRGVLGKTETRAAVKPGGRTWSGKEYARAREGRAPAGGKGGKKGGARRR